MCDADQGSEGLSEQGQADAGSLFGLSEVEREKASLAKFIFEEFFDVRGQGIVIRVDDFLIWNLAGFEKGDDVLLDLLDRQDCKVFLVLNEILNIMNCVLHFCKRLLVSGFNKLPVKLDFDEISLAESLFEMLSRSEAFQSAVNHYGQLRT